MVNLLKAEFLRLVSRRTVWAVMFVLVALTIIQTLTLTNVVAPLTERDHAQAERSYASELHWWEQWRAECDADPTCLDDWDMTEMSPADYLRHVYSLDEFVHMQFETGAVVLLFVIAFVAVFVTAVDFGNGALATQLTFTPRRGSVFGSKVVGGVVAGMGLAVATLVVGTLASSLAFLALRPVSDFLVPPGLFVIAGRFLVTALVCSLVVSLLAMLLGNVIGALGIAGGVVVVSLYASQMVEERALVLRLLPSPNLEALLNGVYHWWVYRPAREDWTSETLIEFPQALLYFVVLIAVLGAASLWRFRRRDLVI